jgi:hypothetical protein
MMNCCLQPFPNWFRVGAAGLILAVTSFAPRVGAAETVEESLARAARFLVSQQDEKEGFIRDKGGNRNETAMSALAVLALASIGHQPSDATPEGTRCAKLSRISCGPNGQEDDGYFGKDDGSRMYGHGITALMLAEMLGMGADAEQDRVLREKCQKAINLILAAQKVKKDPNNQGGWRYTPDAGDSDMSVTVWQTMALRAAKNSGLEVPAGRSSKLWPTSSAATSRSTKTKAVSRKGGFGYQGRGRDLSTTAEGCSHSKCAANTNPKR